jgi:peptidoglycan-associated lipoprotein
VIGEPKPSEPLVPARSNPLYDPNKVGNGELTSTPVKDEFKPTESGIKLGEGFDPSKYTEDRAFFAKDTVYFDFDRSAVRASERVKVEEVATVLKGQPNNVVMIEGHCDERGTEEYNRALGERRALAIREYLINLGIQAERVQTISYGEDKPAELGTGESVWAKNRRGEFILMKPRQ